MISSRLLSVCVAFVMFGQLQVAMAGVITVSMSPSNQSVQQGGSGYVINFSMTTSSTIELGGFNISVTVPNTSGITFTGGESSAAKYVFDLNSLGFLFGNPIDSSSGDIGDLPMTFNQQLIPGTYDLGRMFFDVAPNAPLAIVNVTLDAATSCTSSLLPFDPYDYTPTGGSTIGTITVNVGNATVVPEPSSLIILIGVGVAGWSLLYHRHRASLFKLGIVTRISIDRIVSRVTDAVI